MGHLIVVRVTPVAGKAEWGVGALIGQARVTCPPRSLGSRVEVIKTARTGTGDGGASQREIGVVSSKEEGLS